MCHLRILLQFATFRFAEQFSFETPELQDHSIRMGGMMWWVSRPLCRTSISIKAVILLNTSRSHAMMPRMRLIL